MDLGLRARGATLVSYSARHERAPRGRRLLARRHRDGAGDSAASSTRRSAASSTGTVGIVRDSAAALRVGFSYYLQIVGLVSMSLALLNLLPLLPLDGGHILFSLIEAVRRRALAREVYERVSVVGFALILLLTFIALYNDLTGAARASSASLSLSAAPGLD